MLSEDPDFLAANEPVAALLVTADRRLQQTIHDLAESAGIRIRAVPKITSPLLPKPPLYLFGADTRHLAAEIPSDAPAALLLFESVSTVPAPNSADANQNVRALTIYRLPIQEPDLLRALTHAANTACRQGTVISVVGMAGGVGCTTVALLLAGAAGSLDHETTLVETASSPPAVELALGLERAPGPRWAELLKQDGSLRDLPNPEALRLALPRWRSIGVLTRKMQATAPRKEALAAVIASLARLPGIVIMDAGTPLTRNTAPDLAVRDDICLLVVPRTVAGVVNAAAWLQRNADKQPLVLTRGNRDSVLSHRDMEEALGTEILGEVPEIRRLQQRLDRGSGLPAPQARCWDAARKLLTTALKIIPLQTRSRPHAELAFQR